MTRCDIRYGIRLHETWHGMWRVFTKVQRTSFFHFVEMGSQQCPWPQDTSVSQFVPARAHWLRCCRRGKLGQHGRRFPVGSGSLYSFFTPCHHGHPVFHLDVEKCGMEILDLGSALLTAWWFQNVSVIVIVYFILGVIDQFDLKHPY